MGVDLVLTRFFDACAAAGEGLEGPLLALGSLTLRETPETVREYATANGYDRLASEQSVAALFAERYRVEQYLSCDINGQADIHLDLTQPLPPEHRAAYRSVLNGGTLEHVFDLRQVMQNIHDATCCGGLMIHTSPVTWFDHGFVNINPMLYRMTAAANGYEIVSEGYYFCAGTWPGQESPIVLLEGAAGEVAPSGQPVAEVFAGRRLPALAMHLIALRKRGEAAFQPPVQASSSGATDSRAVDPDEEPPDVPKPPRDSSEPLLLSGAFQQFDGNCWTVPVDEAGLPGADDPDDPSRSLLLLTEDGRELGPPHTSHQLIARDGGGAYSHWQGRLYFSTSDNSDPNRNGRRYEVKLDELRYFERRAAYAVDTLRVWARYIPGGLAGFRDRVVLEIGPGRDMGCTLGLAVLGASRVYAVDRFKGAWQDGWHDKFIQQLKPALAALGLDADLHLLDWIVETRGFDLDQIHFVCEPFETVGPSLAGQIDISVSHSTFEHFYSVPDAARALAACMRAGGIGVHSVDFRDHANFAEPLTFLQIDQDTYADPAINFDYGRGNRVRAVEMCQQLRSAGFSVVDLLPEMFANVDYLEDVVRRGPVLVHETLSRRRRALEILSGVIVVEK